MSQQNIDDASKPKQLLAYYLFYPVLFVMIIWAVFGLMYIFHYQWYDWGIYPRKAAGLIGILTGPFIHDGLRHIFNNTTALFILMFFLFYYYKRVVWQILFWGLILTGVLTWLIGRPSFHIGASGLVYMLVSFLFFSGILIGYYRLIAVSLIIVFLYGSSIWFLFPIVQHISWEGHLSGFVTGLFLAILYRPQLKKIYDVKKTMNMTPDDDAFLKYFDDNGNFIEMPKENSQKNET